MEDLNNVILVADTQSVIDDFSKKVSLLRRSDKMNVETLAKAYECIVYNNPEVCIINIQDYILEDILDLLSRLKANEDLADLPVIAYFQNFHEDVLIKLFDAGIYDYFTTKHTDTIVVMKILWALKAYNIVNQNKRIARILNNFHIVKNKFVTAGYLSKIFDVEINNLIQQKINGNLIIMTPDLQVKDKITEEQFCKILRNGTRASNLLGIKNENKIYVLFPSSNIKSIEAYINKIKKELPQTVTISAGVAPINGESFDNVEKNAMKALNKALNLTDSIIISDGFDKANNSLYDNIQDSAQNFKLFKQNFQKKISAVITPVFYQVQKTTEEKLFETTIEQKVTEDYSNFVLKHKNISGTFRITHPGFSKICIDIYFKQGLQITDKSKESMEIEDLEKGILGDLLNKFIEDFNKKCN